MAKHVLSIEIGEQVTKIVEVDYKKKNPHVYKAVTFATPEEVIEDGVIRDKDVLAVAMRAELKEAGMNEKSVVFSIASSKIATREITIPNVKESKIGALVQATAQEYFPIDLNEYTLAYSVQEAVKDENGKGFRVLLLAAPDSLITNYYNFANEMGFNIESIDYFGNGSMQVLQKEIVLEYCACIQMSGSATIVNFMNQGHQIMQRTISMGVFSVAEAMVLSEECPINDMDSACDALCRDPLICKTLDYEGLTDTPVVGGRMTQEQWSQLSDSQQSRKVATDAVGEILLSVSRVFDFFRSKNPGVDLTSIYITGMGSKVRGIDELFANEMHIPVHRMEHLVNVSFPRHFSEGLYNQTEYIAVVGAAMAPVGFVAKDAAALVGRRENMQAIQLIFGLAVILSVAMIAISLLNYFREKRDNDDLLARKESMAYIEDVYNENEQIKGVDEQVTGIYEMTETHNEYLNSLVNALEEKLPKTMTVQYLESTQEGINMTIESEDDISIARMLMNLEDIVNSDKQKVLTDISIPSVVATEDDNGAVKYDFSVSASYAVPEATAEASAAPAVTTTP